MNQQQVARIAEIVALVMTQMSGKPVKQQKAARKVIKSAAIAAHQTNEDRKAAFAAKVVATFKAKGLTVTPNVDVFTHGKWVELGFKPNCKATFVKTKGMNGNGIALWHKSQVEKIA